MLMRGPVVGGLGGSAVGVFRVAMGNSRADRFGFGLRFLACASLQLEVVDA